MDNRYELASQHGMSKEYIDWFFDKMKDGCGNQWFIMMAAMWEGWKGAQHKMFDSIPTECVNKQAVCRMRSRSLSGNYRDGWNDCRELFIDLANDIANGTGTE